MLATMVVCVVCHLTGRIFGSRSLVRSIASGILTSLRAGVRYEVGISISNLWISWVNGPFPCGSWTDLRIAWLAGGIQEMMDHGERYIADGGYRDGGDFGITPTGLNNVEQRRQSLVRA